jgi:hypothetical protein
MLPEPCRGAADLNRISFREADYLNNHYRKVYSMKMSYCLVILIFILSGCAGNSKIVIQVDPFSRTKFATADMKHDVTQGKLEFSNVRYTRTISEKDISPLRVSFTFTFDRSEKYTSLQMIDETAQIRMGDKFYSIKLLDQHVVEKKTCGGFIVSMCNTKYTITENTILSKEIEKEIMKTNSLMFKLSTNETVVLEATQKQLAQLKELLTLTYSQLK